MKSITAGIGKCPPNKAQDVPSIGWFCSELEKMHKRLDEKKVHYSQCAAWEQQEREGWNDGLSEAKADIKRTIARMKKKEAFILRVNTETLAQEPSLT